MNVLPLRALVPALLIAVSACARQVPRPPALPATGTSVSASPAPTPADGPRIPRSTAEPLRLDLAACVRLALGANRGLLQKAGATERARLGEVAARSDWFAPKLTADYTKIIEEPDDGTSRVQVRLPVYGVDVTPFATSGWQEASGPDEDWSSSYGVTLSRRVFALAERERQRLPVTQAEIDHLVAAADLLSETKRLELEAVRSFRAVQNASARLRVRTARVADARAFLDDVIKNVEHGFKPPVDRLFAEISLNQAETDMAREANNERDAVERLLLLLAQPLDGGVELVEEDLSRLPDLPGDYDTDLRWMLHGHEDLMQADAKLIILEDRIRIARDGLAPELTANLTAERRLTGEGPFDGGVEDDDRLSFGLTLDLPLDAHQGQRARYHQSIRQLADARTARDETAAKLEQQLRSLWRRLERGRGVADLAAQRVETERSRLGATLARYEAGAVDNLEVTRAKQAVDDAEVSLLDARIEVANASAEYRAQLPAVTAP